MNGVAMVQEALTEPVTERFLSVLQILLISNLQALYEAQIPPLISLFP